MSRPWLRWISIGVSFLTTLVLGVLLGLPPWATLLLAAVTGVSALSARLVMGAQDTWTSPDHSEHDEPQYGHPELNQPRLDRPAKDADTRWQELMAWHWAVLERRNRERGRFHWAFAARSSTRSRWRRGRQRKEPNSRPWRRWLPAHQTTSSPDTSLPLSPALFGVSSPGREAEAATVRDRLRRWHEQREAGAVTGPAVVLVHGEPGSGRSTLARQIAKEPPWDSDEVYAVHLRGSLSTRDALLHLLNRLGAPRHTLLFQPPVDESAELDRLRAAYQELVTGRRFTLIVHDAERDEQVLPLIPERSPGLVLITTRQPLAGVRAVANAFATELGPLDDTTGRTMLPGRTPEADTARLLRASGGLPLTLRIAASLTGRPVPDDVIRRSDGVLHLAYEALPEEARRALRRLPLAGEASFGVTAAAALAEVFESLAEALLVRLLEAGFLDRAHGDRYRLHPVIREFAEQRLAAEDTPEERSALQRALLRTYADLAEHAIRRVEGQSSAPEEQAPSCPTVFDTADSAMSWFERESSFITATLRRAGEADPGDVQRLLAALCDFCVLRGDLYRLGRVNELARTLGQAPMVNTADFHSAVAARQVGALVRAQADLEEMVDRQREASDADGEARALRNLGITYHHEGRLGPAEAALRRAVELQGSGHLRYYRAWSLHALAAVVRDQGRLEEALPLLEKALALHREADSPHGQAWALFHWGQLHLLREELDEAEGKLRRSRELYRDVHDERGESWASTQLARAKLLRGMTEEAVYALTQTLRWHQKNEDARGVAWTSYYIGLAHDAADNLRDAEEALAAAEGQFAQLGDAFGLERCRADLARARIPRVRLRLADGEVRVGRATTVELDLAMPRSHPWASTTERLLVVATAAPGADIAPYMRAYQTGEDVPRPAVFGFTARETGSHQLDFRIYHEGHAVLLQEVRTTVRVSQESCGAAPITAAGGSTEASPSAA